MRHIPGQWWGLVVDQSCVILPPSVAPPLIHELWRLLCDGEGLSSIVDWLTDVGETPGDDLSDFGVMARNSEGVHVAFRGPLAVSAETAEGRIIIKENPTGDWSEEIIIGPQSVDIVVEETDLAELWWPLHRGIARVGALRLYDEEEQPGGQVGEPEVAEPEQGLTVLGDEENNNEDEPAQVRVIAPFEVGEDEEIVRFDDLNEEVIAFNPHPSTDSQPIHFDAQPGQTTLMPGDIDLGAIEDGPSSIDDDPELRSTTFYRGFFDGDDAALSDESPIQVEAASQEVEDHDGLTVMGAPLDNEPQGIDDHDGLTVMGNPVEDTPDSVDDDHDGRTVASVDDDDDHDGLTVMGAPSLDSPPPRPPVTAPEPHQPMVLARVCTVCQTPNSTRRVVCRGCQNAISGDAVQIPRPTLGKIRLPEGEIVAIDQPFVIGRRPEAVRFSKEDMPQLIRVDDPHVSATHLRVDLEDWSVVVTNQGRNGTLLRRPGEPDRRFTDQEQVIAQVGDVYCLSSELNVTIVELA